MHFRSRNRVFMSFALCGALILALATASSAGASERAGQPSLDYLGTRLVAYRYVLLGEKHDNPAHHRLQAGLLRRMIELGRRPAVVWEMVERGRQAAIDDFLAGGGTDPDGFAAAVGWAKSGWPDWRLYRPIAEAALAAGLPMIAGNLDRALVKDIARGDAAMDPALHLALKRDLPVAPEVRAALTEEVYSGHCRLVPREQLAPMVEVQLARDASLAEAMVRAGEVGDGAVLIAGNQHARQDIGAGYQLRRKFGITDIVSVGLLEETVAGESRADRSLARQFDFLWFVPPAAPDRDYCAELKAHFKKKK